MSATSLYLTNRNFKGTDDIDIIKDDFYKAKIIVSYDSKLTDIVDSGVSEQRRRIIFTSAKGMRSQKFDKITYECNGLLLEALTWRPLVIPCPTPKSSVNNDTLSSMVNCGKCAIYKVSDGTVVYLYYWAGKWCISTARGVDMAAVVTGTANKSYKEILDDVMAEYNSSFEQFCDLLDKSCSYAFIIRHPTTHLFSADTLLPTTSIIFVHKATVVQEPPATPKLCIKWAVTICRDNHDLALDIPYQEKLNLRGIRVQSLYRDVSKSLTAWLNGQAKTPLYGYIIYSTEPYQVAGDHSCIFLESSLMRQIRQLIYDRKYNEYGKHREIAVVVNAYLSSNKKTFISLFPQYKTIYDKLSTIQTEMLKNLKVRLLLKVPITSPIEQKVNADPVEFLAVEIQSKLTINDAIDFDHILPFINNEKYTRLYLNLFIKLQQSPW